MSGRARVSHSKNRPDLGETSVLLWWWETSGSRLCCATETVAYQLAEPWCECFLASLPSHSETAMDQRPHSALAKGHFGRDRINSDDAMSGHTESRSDRLRSSCLRVLTPLSIHGPRVDERTGHPRLSQFFGHECPGFGRPGMNQDYETVERSIRTRETFAQRTHRSLDKCSECAEHKALM